MITKWAWCKLTSFTISRWTWPDGLTLNSVLASLHRDKGACENSRIRTRVPAVYIFSRLTCTEAWYLSILIGSRMQKVPRPANACTTARNFAGQAELKHIFCTKKFQKQHNNNDNNYQKVHHYSTCTAHTHTHIHTTCIERATIHTVISVHCLTATQHITKWCWALNPLIPMVAATVYWNFFLIFAHHPLLMPWGWRR